MSGLAISSDNSDAVAGKNLCAVQLNIDAGVVQCKRLGKDPATDLSSSHTWPVLVTLSTADQADEVIASAKKLRNSSDHIICTGVFINRFMFRIEAQLAYEQRCKRRLKSDGVKMASNKTFGALQW